MFGNISSTAHSLLKVFKIWRNFKMVTFRGLFQRNWLRSVDHLQSNILLFCPCISKLLLLNRRRQLSEGVYSLRPEEYIPILKSLGVTCIVRFNSKCYDRNVFVNAGIR